MSLIKMPSSPYWYARFMFKGQLYQFSTQTANKNKAQLIHDKKRSDLVDQHHLDIKEQIRFKDAIGVFLEMNKHSPNYTVYERYCKKLQGSVWCNRKKQLDKIAKIDHDIFIHKITMRHVNAIIDNRRERGTQEATINHELSILQRILETCRRLGYETNELDVTLIKKEKAVKPPHKFISYLTLEQEKMILDYFNPALIKPEDMYKFGNDYALRRRTDLYEFMVMCLDLGCRYMELAEMEWSQVDMEKKTVNIRRTKVQNESVLHITDRVYKILQRREKVAGDQKYVFCDRNGKPKNYSTRHLDNVSDLVGFRVTFHVFRKTFASRLIQSGVSISYIQACLGHTSPNMTAKYYACLSPSAASEEVVKVLNQIHK